MMNLPPKGENHSTGRRMAFILGLALILRCVFLSHQSLWLDEIASWFYASGDLGRALRAEATNPPFYYVLLHFWTALFGTSEAALRSLSIVPGMLSVWLVYRLALRLFSWEVAWIAAVYQAVSTFQIYYSQEARAFSLLVSLLLLATLCLWTALTADSRRSRVISYAGYALFAALSLYTHFITVFFLAAHGIFVVLRRPKQALGAAAAAGAALIVFSPWLVTVLRAAGGGGQGDRRYLLLKFPQAYFSFIFGDSLIPLDERAVRHVSQALWENAWLLAAALAATAVLVPYCWMACRRWGDRFLYVANLAVVPVVLAFLFSLKVMMFDERYLIAASPFVYLIIAGGISELAAACRRDAINWKTAAGLAALAAYVVLLGISLEHYYFNPRFGREQWREAVPYIEATASPSTDLLVCDPYYIDRCYRYYQKRDLSVWAPGFSEVRSISSETIRQRAHGFQKIWLVRSHYYNDALLEALRGTFPQKTYREFPVDKGIEVYSFEVGQSDSAGSVPFK